MTTLSSLLRRPRWYAARLAAMPPAEIPHRIAEARRRLAWRRDKAGWQAFETTGDGALADLPALRARLAGFTAGEASRQISKSIRRSCEGRFTFLGEDWPPIVLRPGEPLQIPPAFWFHDPITGKSWPGAATSSFDVDVRSTGTEFGDVKYVWEPNRLQMLHPLAAAIAGTQDQVSRQVAFAIIASWAAANPPYRGVNWKSGLELALRLVSITLIVAAAEPSTLRAEERVMIRRLVVAHARYLAAFPSLYSSANNHRIAEGLGLFLAGALLADLDEAHGWHAEGRRILEVEAARQILADGVGAEQSPTYQAFTMEMLALAAQLAKELGTPLAPTLIERLLRGAEFLSWLVDENGRAPAIGDDDEGRVIAQPPDREPRYVASVIAAVAGLGKRAELAISAHDPHLRGVIFGSARTPSPERTGLRIFRKGGISVANETMNGRRVHLVFDHGPLGLMPLAAHGHADALALWLTIDGEPVFIDAGTYRYFSGGETRSALRESLAHNTLAIERLSHSRAGTAFGWLTTANAHLVEADQGPAWWVLGAHDGYGKRLGIRHARRIRRTQTGLAIDDRLVGGRRSSAVTIRFLCDPDVAVAIDGRHIAISSRLGSLCRVTPPSGFFADVVEAAHSQRFGHIAPAPQLLLTGELAGEVATTSIEIAGGEAADTRAHSRIDRARTVPQCGQEKLRRERWR
ncbi:MAG TPA: alginate lyase family protein [Xanthobacteraceae bacterium]|nr:alginate lyase family protein [Xanthobacteraceae bacterium]